MPILAPVGWRVEARDGTCLRPLPEPVWEAYATMADSTWVPKMDVSKTKDAMIVTTELPGVDANEIGLTLTGNLLTLKGEKGGVEAFPAASIQREGGRAR